MSSSRLENYHKLTPMINRLYTPLIRWRLKTRWGVLVLRFIGISIVLTLWGPCTVSAEPITLHLHASTKPLLFSAHRSEIVSFARRARIWRVAPIEPSPTRYPISLLSLNRHPRLVPVVESRLDGFQVFIASSGQARSSLKQQLASRQQNAQAQRCP